MLEDGSWDERSLKRTLPAVVLIILFAFMALWYLRAMAEKLEPAVTAQDTENIRNRFKDLLPDEMEGFKAYYRHALVEAWIFSFTLPAQAEINPEGNTDWMKKLTVRKWMPASKTDKEWQYSKTDTLQFERDKVRTEELVFVLHSGRIYGRYIAIPPDGDYSKYRERFKEKFKEFLGK
jgi:hypothetical protein